MTKREENCLIIDHIVICGQVEEITPIIFHYNKKYEWYYGT